MRNKTTKIALALGMLLLASQAQADQLADIKAAGVVKVATFDANPPFGSVDAKTHHIVGYDVDFAQALAKALGVKLELVATNPANRIPLLQSGKADLIVADITITPERAQVIDFSTPYFVTGQQFLVPAGSPDKLDEYSKARIGAVKGTTGEQALHQRFPQARVLSYDDIPLALTALRLGGGRAGRGLVAAWVSLFRNTPLLVQLLFWYFAAWNLLPLAVKEVVNDEHAWSILPGNVWWLTPEFLCSMWGLGVFTSAFLVEEIASGLRAVSPGQREAALSQGFTPWQELRFILLPQGLANAWQPIVGQYLNLMKLSSLASGIGFAELTYQVRQIESYNAHALEAFAVGTALYLALGVAMGVALTRLGPGRKLQRSARHER
ncbi:ABC transporter substrate-binding protein/permease [Klebsiella pneumoniae]|nr:ABC transporter substrate-binding protein/permease [Klebsiella pneumoniae]